MSIRKISQKVLFALILFFQTKLSSMTSMEVKTDLEALDENGNTQLLALLNQPYIDEIEKLKDLIKKGADYNAVTKKKDDWYDGFSALMYCAWNYHEECLKELLKQKDININLKVSVRRINRNYNILYIYIFRLAGAKASTINNLLIHGADASVENQKDQSLLFLLYNSGVQYDDNKLLECAEIAKLLLEYGSDPEIINKDGAKFFQFGDNEELKVILKRAYLEHKINVKNKLKEIDILPDVLNTLIHEYLFEK